MGIYGLRWQEFNEDQLVGAAYMFYYFSLQFRENLEAALRLHPNSEKLLQLRNEEVNTDNLSPYQGIAAEGEKMDHDEFIRRLLDKYPLEEAKKEYFQRIGQEYLEGMQGMSDAVKAQCLASAEGLGDKLHAAVLQIPSQAWASEAMQAYKYFLDKHSELDGSEAGHATLVSDLGVSEEVIPFWNEFADRLEAAITY